MSVLFVEYLKCSTCKKARKWLEGNGVAFEARDIVEQNPTADELRAWRERERAFRFGGSSTPRECSTASWT